MRETTLVTTNVGALECLEVILQTVINFDDAMEIVLNARHDLQVIGHKAYYTESIWGSTKSGDYKTARRLLNRLIKADTRLARFAELINPKK